MSYRGFQTSQTGGQQYSETSPISIPWIDEWTTRQVDKQTDTLIDRQIHGQIDKGCIDGQTNGQAQKTNKKGQLD